MKNHKRVLFDSSSDTIIDDADFDYLSLLVPKNEIGIYGWRKRCLYLLVIILVIIIFINISLTLWILLNFNMNLTQNLKILQDGKFKLNGKTVILDELITDKLKVNKILDVKSNEKIRLSTPNGTLSLENGTLKSNCTQFQVVSHQNKPLFTINNSSFHLNSQTLNNSLELKHSLRTQKISSLHDHLQITSSSTTQITAESLIIQTGESLTLNSKNNLTINAQKRIIFQAEEIHLKRLPEFKVTTNENQQALSEVYQLCLCSDGRLYASNTSCFNNSKKC